MNYQEWLAIKDSDMSKSEWLEFCKGTHTKNAYINVFFVPVSQVFFTGWWVYILYRADGINQKIKISIQPKEKFVNDLESIARKIRKRFKVYL